MTNFIEVNLEDLNEIRYINIAYIQMLLQADMQTEIVMSGNYSGVKVDHHINETIDLIEKSKGG